jgi:hypothetical protein
VVLDLVVVNVVESFSLNEAVNEETSESGKEFLCLGMRLRSPLLSMSDDVRIEK